MEINECFKHKHATWQEAQDHIINIRSTGKSRYDRQGELEPYYCAKCDSYHVGHKNRPNKKKKRQPYERDTFKSSRRQKRFNDRRK